MIYWVIPVTVTNLFLNNFKSSKERTKLLDGKEAKFYTSKHFSDINDLKIRPLVTTPRIH